MRLQTWKKIKKNFRINKTNIEILGKEIENLIDLLPDSAHDQQRSTRWVLFWRELSNSDILSFIPFQ